MLFQVVGGAYKSKNLQLSAQECINFYPVLSRYNGASYDSYLSPTPGYNKLFDLNDYIDDLLPGSGCRGMFRTSKGFNRIIGVGSEANGSIIMAQGDAIIWLAEDYTYEIGYQPILLGRVGNTSNEIKFIDDGFGVALVDGSSAYRIDIATRDFANINVSELLYPTDVVFIGGYTIISGQKDGDKQNTFWWSGLYDNATFEADKFASAEDNADPITGMEVAGGYLHLLGINSRELWSPTGDSVYPFERANVGTGNIGLLAPDSLVQAGDAVYFIGTVGQGSTAAYKILGTSVIKISERPLEQEWSKAIADDCKSFMYNSDGHTFVVFTFVTLDKTYVYDITEKEWHRAATRTVNTDTLHKWKPAFALSLISTSAETTTYTGNLDDNCMYELSSDIYREEDSPILRRRVCSHLLDAMAPVMVNAFRVNCNVGEGILQGIDGDDYENPEIMLRYSGDTGRTWSSVLRQGMGATGDYTTVVEFPNLGTARSFTPEISISDSCKTALYPSYIRIKKSVRGW